MTREHPVATRELMTVVAAARRRLARLHVRSSIHRRGAVLLGAAALCAASRPLLWPLDEAPAWHALARAVILAAVGSAVALALIMIHAWRDRPSMLASARRLDGALGLAEVIGSGFAFERDRRDDAMARLAVERARRALDAVTVDELLAPEPRARSRAEARRQAALCVAAALALGVGAIDPLLVERVLHPVTGEEARAAEALRRAAEALGSADPPKDAMSAAVADAARRASAAVERGDRRRARDALDEMRSAARAAEADRREQARALRAVREGAERDGASSARTASEALSNLRSELEASGRDAQALRKLAERLERAAAAARAASAAAAAGAKASGGRAAGREGTGAERREGKTAEGRSAWSRAAEALAEARAAAARGDAESAKRATERAEREIAALEEADASGRATARTRLADSAAELDRSLYAAMRGGPREGSTAGGRDGRREDSDGDPAARSPRASSGGRDGNGPGPGRASDAPGGPEQRGLRVSGDLQVRSDVREGERAVSAIEGMGRGGDPRAYREIFPSYDTVVEDGLREDAVPAARRPTVRRYFSSIRPGDDESRD